LIGLSETKNMICAASKSQTVLEIVLFTWIMCSFLNMWIYSCYCWTHSAYSFI